MQQMKRLLLWRRFYSPISPPPLSLYTRSTENMGKQFKPSFRARLRAAWAIMRAERAVVVTYNPRQPANILGEIHTGLAVPDELPMRLYNAALVAAQYDKMDSEEGQWNALRRAREVLGLNPTQHDT